MKIHLDRIKKITLENLIYFFWGVYILTCFLNNIGIFFINDKIQIIIKVIRYISYVAFAVKIFLDWKNGEKITLPIIIMFLISIAIMVFAKNKSIFFTILILVGLRRMNFEKLIKIALKVFFICFIIVICLAMLGIIPNWEFASRGASSRYALGFLYATDAIGMYLATILMFFYIKKNNATNKELFFLQIINVFMYSYTKGRVSFILISLILFIQFLSKFTFAKNIFYTKLVQRGLKVICNTLPIALFLVLHILIIMYANNNLIAKKVDTLLSSRVKYTYQAYKNYDVNLFGNDIDWNGWGAYGYKGSTVDPNFKYNFVDSSYASIVFDYGILLSCIVILGYRYILIKNLDKKDYWLVFTIIFILIWSFIEQYIINLGKNVFVLSFIPLLEIGEIKGLSYERLKNIIFKKKNA